MFVLVVQMNYGIGLVLKAPDILGFPAWTNLPYDQDKKTFYYGLTKNNIKSKNIKTKTRTHAISYLKQRHAIKSVPPCSINKLY